MTGIMFGSVVSGRFRCERFPGTVFSKIQTGKESYSMVLIILLIYFISLNVFSFVLVINDVRKEKRGERGISDLTIWLASFLGGAWGTSMAMRAFSHKTGYRAYRYGLPVLAIFQIAVVIYFVLVLKDIY